MSTNPTLDAKPVRALAGAVDAAATALRDVSQRVVDTVSDERFRSDVRDRFADLSDRVSSAVTDENLREQVRQRLSKLPAETRALRDEIPDRVKEVPTKAAGWQERARENLTWERRHELMTEVPARLRDAAAQAAHQATKAYDDFADRGEGALARWRSEYGTALGDRVVAVRGQVAEAADDIADAADKVADELKERRDAAGTTTPTAPLTAPEDASATVTAESADGAEATGAAGSADASDGPEERGDA